jgi:sterol desaturase/sphingolipid hydroxylase (fatty acid hydroxylase superfamily)
VTNALRNLLIHPVNYWLGVLVDAAVAAYLVAHALQVVRGAWLPDGAIVLCGLALYGLLEYCIHRWVYHGERSPAAPGHRWHHDEPEASIASPFFVPALVVVGLWALLWRSLGDEMASCLGAALVTGFLYYELLHHAVHHWHFTARVFRILRAHHRIHHHTPTCNYGVSMTVWDWMFGTHYLSRKRPLIRSVEAQPPVGTA